MKICLNCGQINDDQLDLCSKCGTTLRKEEVAQSLIPEPNLPNPDGKGN